VIVTFKGTTFITAEAFISRFEQALDGSTFPYATGDLASECIQHVDARALRALTHKMSDEKKIALTQRRLPGEKMKDGGAVFQYLATKRSEDKKR
jgi:hypothetical protein